MNLVEVPKMTQLTPGRKRRENNYFEPGIRGRKTGIILRDSGVRDEHGFEPIEGIFSSPDKPAEKSARRKSNETSTSSEDMEVAHSPGPDPVEVLTGRKIATQENFLWPPPMSRSPIKTQIGATPRRQSMGHPTSPLRQQHTNQNVSHPTPARLLDFSMNESRPSVERRSMTRRSIEVVTRKTTTPRAQRSPFKADDIHVHEDRSPPALPSPVPSEREQGLAADGAAEAKAAVEWAQTEFFVNQDDGNHGNAQDSPPPQIAEDDPMPGPNDRESYSEHQDARSDYSLSRAPSESDKVSQHGANEVPEPEEAEPSVKKPRKKAATRTKRATAAKVIPRSRASTSEPGAKPKPAHRVRTESADADSVQHTRSGRLSYKPLDYWKGEKTIYQEHGHLETVKEIIRMDDVTPQQPRPKPRARPKRQPANGRKRKLDAYGEDELDTFARDETDTLEPWEMGDGVISAMVRQWDPVMGAATDESREQELALAGVKIEPRDVPLASFRYTKTLTMSFFGSGIVELPPGGFKRSKNSRRMQMIFFVHAGKVNVEVAGTAFTISKGGVWQVPRGNFYSIANETNTTAKIFFAQGCEMAPEPPDPIDAAALEQ